jgi:hypothetical protein
MDAAEARDAALKENIRAARAALGKAEDTLDARRLGGERGQGALPAGQGR